MSQLNDYPELLLPTPRHPNYDSDEEFHDTSPYSAPESPFLDPISPTNSNEPYCDDEGTQSKNSLEFDIPSASSIFKPVKEPFISKKAVAIMKAPLLVNSNNKKSVTAQNTTSLSP